MRNAMCRWDVVGFKHSDGDSKAVKLVMMSRNQINLSIGSLIQHKFPAA